MPRRHPRRNCKFCGAHRDDVGELSARGLCLECGKARVKQNILEMQARSGPFADHHRKRLIYSLGGVIRDGDSRTETV